MVETLDAVIRMKNGSIDLSGSADLGFADVAGNGYKETLDQVVGDLHLGDLGDIQYTGSGTLYATNNIHINGDLMPTGNYLDDSGGSGTENSLGLIADGNVEIATGGGAAGVKIMAAIFAEHQTTIAKQSGLQAGRPDYSPQLA